MFIAFCVDPFIIFIFVKLALVMVICMVQLGEAHAAHHPS